MLLALMLYKYEFQLLDPVPNQVLVQCSYKSYLLLMRPAASPKNLDLPDLL